MVPVSILTPSDHTNLFVQYTYVPVLNNIPFHNVYTIFASCTVHLQCTGTLLKSAVSLITERQQNFAKINHYLIKEQIMFFVRNTCTWFIVDQVVYNCTLCKQCEVRLGGGWRRNGNHVIMGLAELIVFFFPNYG